MAWLPAESSGAESSGSVCWLGRATGSPGTACGLQNLSHFRRINDSSII